MKRAIKRLLKAAAADAAAELRPDASREELLAHIGVLSARLDRFEHTLGLTADRNEQRFATPDFATENNAFSRVILAMRAKEKSNARLTLRDYEKCFGFDDVWTEDDRFLSYVYRTAPLAHPWITGLPR